MRVLGADTLLASAVTGRAPDPADVAVCDQAIRAHQPAETASLPSRWTHWAMVDALSRFGGTDVRPQWRVQPPARWLEEASWQELTHQLAVLGALALPGADCAVARVAAARPVDLARGFVRAVRRRDWRQAAAAGRWLCLSDEVPGTLGLGTGLEFVAMMGEPDPIVALHLEAARAIEDAGSRSGEAGT